MGTTRQNLDIQSDKVLTEPTIQTRINAQDLGATQSLFLDWEEPAGADRTVLFEDPVADDAVVYKNKAQVLQNKQTTTVATVGDDITNKDYVDGAIAAAAAPTATSGPGGGIEGTVSADSNLGLQITAGVMSVKVDGATLTFNGSGQLIATTAIPDATAGSGGGVKGKVTADSDKGLNIVSGVMEVKVDGISVGFNLSGEIETIGGGPSAGPTGTVSAQPQFVEEINSVTPPNNGFTGGGDISTLDFPAGVVTGIRFSMCVPEDYFSGPMQVQVVQQMSAADPAGSVELAVQAKIVDVSAGIIDAASYPSTQITHTVPTTTDVERRTFLNIAAGDFARGDTIQVLVRRLGNDPGDIGAADWRALAFVYSYTAIVNGRIATVSSKFFENAAGETATTPNTISAGDITVEDFPTAVDTGLKFEFTVPDHWDEISDCDIRFNYVMASNDPAGVVRLESRAKIARIVGGTIDTFAPVTYDLTPGAGGVGTPKKTPAVVSIPAASLSRGDTITLVIARRGTAIEDTHIAAFELICAMATFGTVNSLDVSAVTIYEEYLNQGVFGNVIGAGINADTDYADLTDFETYDRVEATSGAGSIDIAYQGRLGALTSTIKAISFFIKGTGTASYTLEVHVEGAGLVHTTGPVAPAAGATEVLRSDVDLSTATPIGGKRFFVVIKVTFSGAAEEVLVSRPFVRVE